jgi:hypothetical protein
VVYTVQFKEKINQGQLLLTIIGASIGRIFSKEEMKSTGKTIKILKEEWKQEPKKTKKTEKPVENSTTISYQILSLKDESTPKVKAYYDACTDTNKNFQDLVLSLKRTRNGITTDHSITLKNITKQQSACIDMILDRKDFDLCGSYDTSIDFNYTCGPGVIDFITANVVYNTTTKTKSFNELVEKIQEVEDSAIIYFGRSGTLPSRGKDIIFQTKSFLKVAFQFKSKFDDKFQQIYKSGTKETNNFHFATFKIHTVSQTINHYITVVKEELEQLKSIYNFGSQFLFKEEGPLQFVLSKPYLWLPSNILQLGYVDCDRKSNVVQSNDNILEYASIRKDNKKGRVLLNYIGCNDWNIQLDTKNWFNKWKPPAGTKRCTVGAASFILIGNMIKYHIPIYSMQDEWSSPLDTVVDFIPEDEIGHTLDSCNDHDCEQGDDLMSVDENDGDDKMQVEENCCNSSEKVRVFHTKIPVDDCLCSVSISFYCCSKFELTQVF